MDAHVHFASGGANSAVTPGLMDAHVEEVRYTSREGRPVWLMHTMGHYGLSVRVFALWSELDAPIEEVRAYAENLATFTRPYESKALSNEK